MILVLYIKQILQLFIIDSYINHFYYPLLEQAYGQSIQFAPIGLLKMYNSGGAVKAVHFAGDSLVVEGRGCGLFGAHSSREPKSCGLNSEDKDFEFNNGNNLLTLMIPSGVDSWEIEIYF